MIRTEKLLQSVFYAGSKHMLNTPVAQRSELAAHNG